jgi:hypothetical protein
MLASLQQEVVISNSSERRHSLRARALVVCAVVASPLCDNDCCFAALWLHRGTLRLHCSADGDIITALRLEGVPAFCTSNALFLQAQAVNGMAKVLVVATVLLLRAHMQQRWRSRQYHYHCCCACI